MPDTTALQDAASLAGPPGSPGPRRVRPIYRVFVSSTWLDLQPERRALMEALNRMEEMRFVGMEFFGNRPDDTHDASIDQVDLCEVFIGIIGFRYGSGITEAEYRRARALGLPCFVYFKREDTARPELTDNDTGLAAKLAMFKQELLRGHTVKEFARPEELAANATADLHNWVAARWISLEREPAAARPRPAVADADRTNILRLLERIEQDWIKGVLEASLHHRAWLELGLDWREDAVEHPWDRIVVAPDRPIKTLSAEDSITGVFDAAQHTLLVLGEPGAGKTTTVLELARELIARARESAQEPAPVVLALSTWRGQQRDLTDWLITELGLRYQVPKRVARAWLEECRLVLILDGLDEVVADRRAACVEAINAFEQAHHPPGLAVTCRVAEYDALAVKLRLRSAICLQPLTAGQIEHYFKAAGTGLDHLRLALRDDAGLRELARSPLMLSVMTMAWRDAPAIPVKEQGGDTIEERRRQLFDAYVQATMKRRGKASGGYSAELTIKWLTWLARRMKENGHTLFALEQLQPGWLDGTWRQLGYFLASRLMGAAGLVLPFLFLKLQGDTKALVAGLSLVTGSYIGIIDFALARHGWGGSRRAALRLWTLLAGLVVLSLAWLGLSPDGESAGIGTIYLLMTVLAFCAPLDVRALDIKPTGSMQWSWRLALARGLSGLVAMNLIVTVGFAINLAGRGWARGMEQIGLPYFVGLALAAVPVGLVWDKLRPPPTVQNVAGAITLAMIGGQIGGSGFFGAATSWSWEFMLVEIVPATLLGVFGGFGSTMIDPARPQQAGAWFWLRVPVLAFFVVGLVMIVPGLVLLPTMWDQLQAGGWTRFAGALGGFGAACGLVAFLRFGGFNGAQHYFLRWQLARRGDLPPRPESFFNHAAQLALMQKVGLGYRFVHALLLQHLAASRGGAGEEAEAGRAPAARSTEEVSRRPRAWLGLRLGALLGLTTGLGLFGWIGAATFALSRLGDKSGPWEATPALLGALMLAVALAIPVLLLVGRWLWDCSWRWLGGGYLGLALALVWLAADDPVIRRPSTPETIAPAFPGAEKSHAVLQRYDYGQPAAKNFRWKGFNFSQGPEQGPIWRNFLLTHRAEIEANWAKLAPVRDWMDELNAFERIGDLNENLLDLTMIWYPVRLAYAQNAMAIASLRAIDGQGDAALAGLLPLLEVGGKLEISARARYHFAAAREMQRSAILAAGFVLDTTPVSAATRMRFAAALSGPGGGPAGARRIHALSYGVVCAASTSFGRAVTAWVDPVADILRWPLALAGPFVFNRRATINRWGDLMVDLQEFAARREIEKVDQRVAKFMAEERRPHFKSVGSAWFSREAYLELRLVDTSRTVKGYWATEDLRTVLLARLGPP